MPCKAPRFWWNKPGKLSAALKPMAAVYQAGHRLLQKNNEPYTPPAPVICVGNAVVGGSGKTPAVQALCRLLREENLTAFPAILLRGYGGKLHGPSMVVPSAHSARDVGDEALLHARYAATVIARDRQAGAKLAQLSGCDFILMDDGLQNAALTKTVSLLMVDEAQGLGNGLTLPAGPLREPLQDVLAKTDAIILTGHNLPFETDKPVFRARIEADNLPPRDSSYYAFAGLGHPEKFRRTLEDGGLTLAGWKSFPDHHAYTEKDLAALTREAEAANARLITTEKDYVRLPDSCKEKVGVLAVRMVFENPDALMRFIKNKLSGA